MIIFAGGMDREDVVSLVATAESKHTDLASGEAELIIVLSKDRAGRNPSVLRVDWPLVILIVGIDMHTGCSTLSMKEEKSCLPFLLRTDMAKSLRNIMVPDSTDFPTSTRFYNGYFLSTAIAPNVEFRIGGVENALNCTRVSGET